MLIYEVFKILFQHQIKQTIFANMQNLQILGEWLPQKERLCHLQADYKNMPFKTGVN